MKCKNRVLCAVLAVMLVITFIPVQMFAYAEETGIDENLTVYEKNKDAFIQDVIWVDNHDEEKNRPDTDSYGELPMLTFSMDEGSTWILLTTENMAQVGLKIYPVPSVTTTDTGAYRITYQADTLPTVIVSLDQIGEPIESTRKEIQWKLTPPELKEYDIYAVSGEAGPDQWNYILKNTISVKMTLRTGNTYDLTQEPEGLEELKEILLDEFQLYMQSGDKTEEKSLRTLYDEGKIQITVENGKTAAVTITDGWKYDLDGTRITYFIKRESGTEIPLSTEPGSDQLKITYDNTKAPNYGSYTTEIYDQGTIYLTLTGETSYRATKNWQDETGDQSKRPDGILQLWRYVKGESFTTAAPVRKADGTFYQVDLNREKDAQDIAFPNEDFPALPKYNQDGYEYEYVLIEYLEDTYMDAKEGKQTANLYEQMFGEAVLNEETGQYEYVDTLPEGMTTRDPKNFYVYNGGTLSNKLSYGVTANMVKTWKAAAFQSDFGDVKVEFTLECRRKNDTSPEDDWKTAFINGEKVVITKEGFTEEELAAWSPETETYPRYDAKGYELEYRWAETGVYQGKSDENLLQEDQTFTLEQSERQITYVSESVSDNGREIITNSIANTIDYKIRKLWAIEEEAAVTFSLYRYEAGSSLDETMQPYLTFTMNKSDKDGEETTVTDRDGKSYTLVHGTRAGQEYNEDSTVKYTYWDALLKDLPEFDEDGRQYEYLLLEQNVNTDYIPTYETKRDTEMNYYTRVYNGPGGPHIMVRKEWADDSDTGHRQPVFVEVYYENECIGGTWLGEDGDWNELVSVPEKYKDELNKLKIIETKVLDGESEIEVKDDTYTSQYHRYAVTYLDPVNIAGEWVYTVRNQRVGTVDVNVTKTWADGNGQLRDLLNAAMEQLGISLSLRLDFAESSADKGYSINYDDNTMTLGGKPVSIQDGAICKVNMEDVESTYTWQLPKYDEGGAVVHYVVDEVWLDSSGNEIDDIKTYLRDELSKETYDDYDDLMELMDHYSVTCTETYEVNPSEAEEQGESVFSNLINAVVSFFTGEKSTVGTDVQTIHYTNGLTGTKSAFWHKQWNDDYAYEQNLRPDLYLDIYQVVHTGPGEEQTKTQLYKSNYRWNYSDEMDEDNLGNPRTHWHAVLSNLPMYDEYGYEIIYYAVERTKVNAVEYDYETVRYSFNDVELGDKTNADTEDGYALNIDVTDGEKPSDAGDDYANYALREGGTFTNTLSATFSLTGQKIWRSLPADYPDVDLPALRFAVERSYTDRNGELHKEETPVAYMTVSDWASVNVNGTYKFDVVYEGENKMVKDADGTLATKAYTDKSCTVENENPTPLPKYTPEGYMYTYTMTEIEIQFQGNPVDPSAEVPVNADDSRSELTDIFETTQPGINTYIATNAYSGVEGKLIIKKILELPTDSEGNVLAYPAVQFELTRSYTGINEETGKPEMKEDAAFKITKTWSSEEVEAAYESQTSDPKPATVSGMITFENLPKYAPNGSKYLYTAAEVKDGFLEGYDTWADLGDRSAEYLKNDEQRSEVTGLWPAANEAVDATFLNHESAKEYVTVSGTKNWDDFENVFGLRPETIKLQLYRQADSQPGQNNGIANNAYGDPFEVTPDADGQWKVPEKLELEKYAPNGMPWRYTVKEVNGDGYYTSSLTQSDNTTVVLTNKLTTSVKYQKNWTDGAGNVLTADYLGTDLAVTFRLQVQEKGNEDGSNASWMDAEDYFIEDNFSVEILEKLNLSGKYEVVKSGRVNAGDSAWSGTIDGLPRVIKKKDSDEPIRLNYRVVETEVELESSNISQIIKVSDESGNAVYSLEGNGIVKSAVLEEENEKWITTNRLDVLSLTVSKIWAGDSSNAYATRPGSNLRQYDWQTDLLVQRSSDGGEKWENVKVYGNNAEQDLIISVYGMNEDSTEAVTVTGLPAGYLYRIRELQPGRTTDFVKETGQTYYNGAYTAAYNEDNLSVTNTLIPGGNDGEYTLIYAEKVWKPEAPADSDAKVTFDLQYLAGDGETWKTLASVELDGVADVESSAQTAVLSDQDSEAEDETTVLIWYEQTPWKAVWKGLPKKHPDSSGEATQYRVVESKITPASYILLGTTITDETSYRLYTFTNVPETSLKVEKEWVGVEEEEKKEVVVGLYRTTSTEKNETEPFDEVTLNEKNGWQAVINNLPGYDADGNRYTYYARELKVGDEEASETDLFAEYDDKNLDDGTFSTRVYNISTLDIHGVKTWKDNSNAYLTRPDGLRLILKRTTVTTDQLASDTSYWEEVSVEPTWSKDGNAWTYTFTNLPKYSKDGEEYAYRVYEEIPAGYQKTGQEDYRNFTNTLTGYITVSGTKTWVDNSGEGRPDDIALKLQRTTEVPAILDSTWEAVKVEEGNPTWTKDGDVWTYTYSGLPKYNPEGVKYTYRVVEDVPDDYDVKYDADSINMTNVKRGGLTVSKEVTGNRGETDREFHFTVTLTGTSTAGINAEEIDGTYGDMTFCDGVATFTLKHGQGMTASGLPGGLTYTVYEEEANKEGYSTAVYLADGKTAAVAGGTIPAGTADERVFRNHRSSSVVLTTTVSGTKTWVDKNDKAEKRPDSLILLLYRSVEGGAEERVSASPRWMKNGNVWSYSFTNLPAKDSSGRTYIYRVEEIVPGGYEGQQNGNHFINTYEDKETIDIPVTKIWTDGNDKSRRPSGITVALYANGKEVDRQTLTAAGSWKGIFAGVPKVGEDGEEIRYVVKETDVPDGYAVRYQGFLIENIIDDPNNPVPDDPDEPGNPGKPSEPDNPDEPGASESTPGSDSSSPKTGDDMSRTAAGLMALAILSLAGVIFFDRKARVKQKKVKE